MMKMILSKKIDIENFNLMQIADSGQCFRMNRVADEFFMVVAGGRCCKLKEITDGPSDTGKSTNLPTNSPVKSVELFYQKEDDLSFWEDYFHLDYDYGKVVKRLLKNGDTFLKEAVNFGNGLRILRQEAFETLISFIISQNKNIPAIKNSVGKLCERYGEEKYWKEAELGFFTFPEPEKLAGAKMEDLRALGLGYRDVYVKNASVAVACGDLNLAELSKLETESLMKELMSIKGVGKKVASCVALFGFGKMDALPVDVWIDRVNKDVYGGSFNWEEHGEIAGLVQQYFFYYMRNGKKHEA